MRVTTLMMHFRVLEQIRRGSEDLFKSQEQVATQRRINRLSDDPIGSGEVMNLRALTSRTDQYLRNLDHAETLSNIHDNVFDDVIDTISRAKELLLSQASNIASSPQTREASRVEMVSLLQTILTASNTRLGTEYVFAGFLNNTAPFLDASIVTTQIAGAGTATVTNQGVYSNVQLTGDDYEIQFLPAGQCQVVNTTTGATVVPPTAFTPGTEIRFDGIGVTLTAGALNGDVFRVQSAAYTTTTQTAGPVTATVTNERVFNNVLATGDVYEIQFLAGGTYQVVNTTTGATVIPVGAAYVGATEIQFDGIGVTLSAAGANGDVFQVVTTSIDAGTFVGDNGDIQLELEEGERGTINLTGDAVFQGSGLTSGVDLFDIFNRAIYALAETDPAIRDPAIESLIDEMDEALTQVSNFQSVTGSRQSRYEGIETRLENLGVWLEQWKSDTEDIDIADVLTTLTLRETAYQATLAAAARVIQPTLLDFLV
jgi:flagellar hook-associated protein 3 FlgL